MKRFIFVFIFIVGHLTLQSQTVIAKQSFEASGDTWTPLNFSTPPCTVGNDIWNYSTGLPSISPNEGSQFWGIRDLDGSCGGTDFESIIFPNVDISSFTNVTFSFDYNAINFDNNEDLKYELFYNGASQGEVIVVNGVAGNSDNTNGWLTETVSVPADINSISVVLFARCNRGNERAGFDNVQLFESITSSLTNNDCGNATILTVGANNTENIVTGTNVGSTSSGELPNPTCGNYLGNDIWYTAQVPASGIITVETQSVAGSNIDTAIAVYSGNCGNLTQLACNDDINFTGGNLNSQIELTGIPNTTIYVRVWAWNNNSVGDFNIVAYSTPSIVPNDNCFTAQTLTVGSTNTENVVTGTNIGATGTNPAPSPNCDGYQGGDVWFTAQIPASGILNIETSNAGGITDTGLAVYTGSCDSLTQIDCDADSGPGFFSVINLTGLPNTTVYIRVWEYQNNNFGEFNIVAYSPECPFTTTWNGNNWNNGTPNTFTSAIINGNYDTASNGSFDSCNCTINNNRTVNIRANNYISILNDLTVSGTLEVRHEGSLVMVEDDGIVTSSGTINIHKTTNPYGDPLDYTYWSSPTINETFGSALASSRPDRFFEFDIVNGWINKNLTDIMETAKGYIGSAPNTGTFPQSQSVVFDGVVHNGIIQTPNFQDVNFNWNIIGNPYPSAIDADLFINDPTNSAILNSTIYLWTHNTPISDTHPGEGKYNYTAADYATYTAGIGGTAATGDTKIPTGSIASAQGFLAQGLTDGVAIFNNSMRITTNNDQFFKSAETENTKDRIWLNLFNNKGAFSQLLIGFIENGTNGIDRYDGTKLGGSYISFYSISEEKQLAVQSKPTITNEETIKLGLYSYIEENDSLQINIERIEGELNNYTIYLRDKLLNKIHDLNIEDYTFIPEPESVYDDRFELILTKSQVLSTDEITSAKNELLVSQLENSIEIKTINSSTITQLKIYDLLGKTIVDSQPNNTLYSLKTNSLAEGTILLLNATLDNNEVLTKKIILY